MRILFTNNTLGTRAGTELYVYDVACRLKKLGHAPAAFSLKLGEVAKMLQAAGIPVVDNLASLPFRPDLIHAHHHMETMTALLALPGVPAVHFCHGAMPWEEMPPLFPRIFRHVAVDLACRDRVIKETGLASEQIRVLFNFVDLERFQPRPPLPSKPKRALIFSNYATEQNYIGAIRPACASAQIELDVRGSKSGNAVSDPEKILPQYDLVFAKGRAALEAMAVGCAVILCDVNGCGPMVRGENFDELRPLNFGLRTLTQPTTAENIAARIARYDAEESRRAHLLVRERCGLIEAVEKLTALYAEVLGESRNAKTDPVEELRAAGAYLQSLDSGLKSKAYNLPILLPPTRPADDIALPARKKGWWFSR